MKKFLLTLATALIAANAYAQSEADKPVYNETTGVGYETFKDAFNAITSDQTCTLIITGNVDITERMMFDSSKKSNITIKGKNSDSSLVYRIGDKIMFVMKQNAVLTFEDIIIDGNNSRKGRSLIEAEGKALTLKNVTIKNFNSTSGNGLINLKNTAWGVFENVTVEGCEDNNYFNLQRNSSAIYGVNKFHARLADGIFLKNEGVTDGNEINITLATPTLDAKVVDSCDNPSYFHLTNEGFKLAAKEGNLVTAEDTESAVKGIGADNEDAPAEYYNLQGVKVANPDKGIYIVRKGTSVSKVIL